MNLFQSLSQSGHNAWPPSMLDPNAWQALLQAPSLDTRPITATIK